jgi:peptide-methionine (S)-S-oxide reductase
VLRTRVGYAGGTKKDPTYHDLGDHTETVQLDYDPSVISYEKLLEVFWSSTNSCEASGSRQYMSAIFTHNQTQRQLALAARERAAARLGRKVAVPVLPLDKFYLAEDYHQKWYLRQRPALYRELRAIYPDLRDFMRSTAAARINGFLGGFGSPETLTKELSSYGLSEQAAKLLRDEVQRAPATGR